MGSGQSSEVGGVRVFKVSPGSPAAEAGLEVFFDFIIEVNGVKMDPGYGQVFKQKIQESENSTAKLTVFNTRAHGVREVNVKPRKWAGNGLLGATVHFDTVDPEESHGIRVLEVFVNSPAAHAGLVPYQDFLLGTASSVFHDIDELVEVVNSNLNKEMQVYVYNADAETVREVPLVPNNDWGGEGCIGCDIGTGLLHRIPAPRRPPGSAPSDKPVGPPAMPSAAQGTPAISATGAWPPAAGLPAPAYPPAYPPGMGPQGQHPNVLGSVVVPPGTAAVAGGLGLPTVPGVPAVPAVPGIPAAPGVAVAPPAPAVQGIPPVPQAPSGAPGSMPAIKPSGTWAPPPAPVVADASADVPQAPVPPATATVAQLQAQIQQPASAAAAASMPAPKAVPGKVAVSWPPQPKQQVTLPAVASPNSDIGSPSGLGGPLSRTSTAGDVPQAPPSTPMSDEIPVPQVDFSQVDPARFAPATSPVTGGITPGAAVL